MHFKLQAVASLLFLLLLGSSPTKGQGRNKESELIILANFIGGYAVGTSGGLSGGLAINVQIDRHVIILRGIQTVKPGASAEVVAPFTVIPVVAQKSNMQEASLLYGWSFPEDERALSFAIGPSKSSFTRHYPKEVGGINSSETGKYLGVAFDAGITWFKEKSNFKRRKSTWLMSSGAATTIGFRAFGNLSKHSYFGIGLNVGIGYRES